MSIRVRSIDDLPRVESMKRRRGRIEGSPNHPAKRKKNKRGRNNNER